MKTIVFSVVSLLLPFVLASGQDSWGWKETSRGIECCSRQIELSGVMQSISAVRYNSVRHKTRVYCANGTQADSTSALAVRINAKAAVNAGYFNIKTRYPVTYIKQAGKGVVGHTTPEELFRTDGVLAVKRCGKVDIMHCDTTEYANLKRYREVFASGPVLLLDGKSAREEWPADGGFYPKRHPRTVFGTDRKGRAYFIVIDGRLAGQGEGTSIAETVTICQMLGLQNAINLDGGGSSLLWEKNNGVLSHPCGNRKYDHCGQRVIPNILYIK
jgi:exopolysaccharide biosynthesis protein